MSSSNKLKITLKSAVKLEFYLEEKGEKGDYISLDNFNDVDFSILKDVILKEKDSILNDLWNDKKNDIILNSKEFKESNKKISTLEEIIIDTKAKIDKINSEKENEIKEAKLNLEKESISKIAKLESENNTLEKHMKDSIKFAVNESEKAKDKTINDLSMNIEKLINEKENEIKEAKLNLEKESIGKIAKLESEKNMMENNMKDSIKFAVNESEKIKDKKINDLYSELEKRYTDNSKIIGENLESWIEQEFNKYMLHYKDISFEKANTIKDGTKPDFIFKVFDDENNLLTSITIEAKSEMLNSKTKKKNSHHWEKLNIDKEKNLSEYSLLITELEKEDSELTLRSVGKYKNMFESRPNHFITFLMLIHNLAMHKKEISGIDFDLKEKQIIMQEFESMKNDIINVTLKNMNNNSARILKMNEKIRNISAEQHSEIITLDNHMVTIENKINKFKIEKIIKKMESLK